MALSSASVLAQAKNDYYQHHYSRRSSSESNSVRITRSPANLPSNPASLAEPKNVGYITGVCNVSSSRSGQAEISRPQADETSSVTPSLAIDEAVWARRDSSSNDILTASDTYRSYINSAMDGPELPQIKPKRPFHKWIQSFHHRRQEDKDPTEPDANDFCKKTLGRGSLTGDKGKTRSWCSSSVSSYAFVSAAREASMSVAGTSIVNRSWRRTLLSSRGQSRTDRSSRASVSARHSEDSHFRDRQLQNDPVVIERSLHRRRILEELIKTEEGYIGDVRFLMNAYVTILASLPSLQVGLRSSINRNLTDIVELHEELLGELHKSVPDSEYTQLDLPTTASAPPVQRHHRWRSLDAVPEDKSGILWIQNVSGMTASPQVGAEVAKVFLKRMNRFFIYEEYGAQLELMFKDVDAAHKTIPHWDKYQKGIETLASCLSSKDSRIGAKKALTIGDLLAKPIQRMCRYPLLFSELLKYTPVCDCPCSYMEIENALARLREVTGAMNRAANDELVKVTLERTWLLQDRLVFPNQKMDAVSKNGIRSLGHVNLCGVLHVCWQTKDSVAGRYMTCILYRNWLCLASVEKAEQMYTIQACIPLDKCSLEEADNGRGLQCHTASFSWKLSFECDYQLYEIIMTACSPREEHEWRRRLDRRARDDSWTQPDQQDGSFLALNIKSLGTVFSKPGTAARRLSIRRATTVGSKSQLCQVILTNTNIERETKRTVSPRQASINRSRSLQANTRMPVLAPSRGDRARMEALVSDVWTREVLPFPGITVRARSERLVRSSASSVIRKLSVASFTGTFGKRSLGRASPRRTAEDVEEEAGPCEAISTRDVVGSKIGPNLDKASHDDDIDDSKHLSSDVKEDYCDVEGYEWAKKQLSDCLPDFVEPVDEMIREAGGLAVVDHNVRPNCASRRGVSEASSLSSSIHRTMCRLFESAWFQNSSGTVLANRKSRDEGDGTLNNEKPLPARGSELRVRSMYCLQTPHVRHASSQSTVDSDSCDSMRQGLYPLTRQTRKYEAVKSQRRWSARAIFHRGSPIQTVMH